MFVTGFAAGQRPAEVAASVAVKFGVEVVEAQRLVCDWEHPIRSDLDSHAAAQYEAVLRSCGCLVRVEPALAAKSASGLRAGSNSKSQVLGFLAVVGALGMTANALIPPQKDSVGSSSAPTVTAVVRAPGCGVRKKDGTVDARACDLEELCKDWYFYRRKIVQHANAGANDKAAEARVAFQRVNVWLSAYYEADQTACLERNAP